MTVEMQLKEKILERYKSVRAFTVAIDIPYTTLDSVFKRGLLNAGIGTMIKVFSALDLDIESASEPILRQKISPAPTVSETEQKPVTKDELLPVLKELGYVSGENELTDSDVKFLTTIIRALDEWFQCD